MQVHPNICRICPDEVRVRTHKLMMRKGLEYGAWALRSEVCLTLHVYMHLKHTLCEHLSAGIITQRIVAYVLHAAFVFLWARRKNGWADSHRSRWQIRLHYSTVFVPERTPPPVSAGGMHDN